MLQIQLTGLVLFAAVRPPSQERELLSPTASPIFVAQSGHLSNRARDSFFGHPEEILLIFQVTDEHAGFDPDEWFSVQSSHDRRDVEIVQLRKLSRPQFMVAVLSGCVMSGAQRDRG